MALYIHLNTRVWNETTTVVKYLPTDKLLIEAYKVLKTVLEGTFFYSEKGISIWKYAPIESVGELINPSGKIDLLSENPFGIARIEGDIYFADNRLSIILEIAVDKSYSSVYGNINLQLSLESGYEDLCDFLDAISESEYKNFIEKLSLSLSKFNGDLLGRIKELGYVIAPSCIDYAYISRFPVDKDVTELYFWYRPAEKASPAVELLTLEGKTLIENKEVEKKSIRDIDLRLSALATSKSVIKFLSSIEEVKEKIETMQGSGVSFSSAHSLTLIFNRNKEEREKLYNTFKNGIFIPFFTLLPEKEEIEKKIIQKIENLKVV
ncbi:MAG: hypothetical protein QXJ93_01305 [Candidatus Rehaiarchaeum fermentans]|nr:hypothetical protein [Candidatus Rehaiarchaeum fermentans]